VFSAFVEGAEGTRSLHRIVVAAIFVFGVINGAGAGTLRLFFTLGWTGTLDRLLRAHPAARPREHDRHDR